jgi:hypothetical protein
MWCDGTPGVPLIHQRASSSTSGHIPAFLPVLRIRDVIPGSELFPSRIRMFFIPDPNFFHPKFKCSIPDPRSPSKNFCILTPKTRQYDPGCLSRNCIPDPDFFYLSRIPDPGSGSTTLLLFVGHTRLGLILFLLSVPSCIFYYRIIFLYCFIRTVLSFIGS